MKVLFLSHTFIGGNYFVGSHALHSEAQLSGHHSLHISTPISFFHGLKYLFKMDKNIDFIDRKKKSKEGLKNNSYIPRTLFPINIKLSKYFLSKKLRNVLDANYDQIFIDQVLFLNILPNINSKNILMRITDKLKHEEINIMKKYLSPTTQIIVTNKNISDDLLPYFSNIRFIPNPIISDLPELFPIDESLRKGCVYIGALDGRIDWEYIKNLARKPEFEIIHLFGTGQIPSHLPENVVYFGHLDHDDVLSVLPHYRFGLLPYKATLENKYRSPIKTADYVASDLIIIRPQAVANFDMFHGLAAHDPLNEKLNCNYELTEKKALENITWKSVWTKLSVD
jgi:hypothetical protein